MITREFLSKSKRLSFTSALIMPMLMSQTSFSQEEKKEVEKIEVTGSRIKKIDTEGASPMTTFNRDEIDQSGQVSVADFLRGGADGNASLSSENETLEQTAGSASFSGRGFDQEYTVVLINGRRIPTNAIGESFSDLNLIPMAAVERIEYLADGASAIYGADAVAGVLNIVTKRDFNGTSAVYQTGQAFDGQGFEESYQFVTGLSTSDGNLLIAYDYLRRETIAAKDRPFAKSAISPEGEDGRSPFGTPGFVVLDEQGGENIPWETCGDPLAGDGEVCPYDFAPLYQVQPRSERQSMMVIFDRKINEDLTVFGELRYSRAFTHTANGAAPGYVALPKESANNPYGEDVTVARRYLEFGPRRKDNLNEVFSTTLGLKGHLGFHDWDIAASRSYLRNTQTGAGGQVWGDSVADAFKNDVLNPFDLNFETDEQLEALDLIDAETFREGKTELKALDGIITGPIPLSAPGGELAYAFGVQFIQEEYQDRSDVLSAGKKILGGAGGNGGGDRESRSMFGEVSVPLLEPLNLSLAARYDDLYRSGKETTYKGSISYKPLNSLLFRASYGTGFKAPDLHRVHLDGSYGVERATDTAACNKDSAKCSPVEINSITRGNKTLKSEHSKAINLGIVFQPTDETTISTDYYKITVEDQIGALTVQEILNNEEKYSDRVLRDSAGNFRGKGSYVETKYENLSEGESSGLEVKLNQGLPTAIGKLGMEVRHSRLLSYKRQTSSTEPLCDRVNEFAKTSVLRGTWSKEAWKASFQVNHRSEYDATTGGFKTGTCDLEKPEKTFRVKQNAQLAIQGGYKMPWGTEITLGINNVTNESPAYDPYVSGGWPFYDQGAYRNAGRFMYARLAHDF